MRYPVGNCIDHRAGQCPLGSVMTQQALLRKFGHLHRIINNLAAAVQAWSIECAANLDDVEVDARCKSTIQAQFLVAEMVPLIQRGKVEEAEINRFLDLVRVIAGQNDPGNMGFD